MLKHNKVSIIIYSIKFVFQCYTSSAFNFCLQVNCIVLGSRYAYTLLKTAIALLIVFYYKKCHSYIFIYKRVKYEVNNMIEWHLYSDFEYLNKTL